MNLYVSDLYVERVTRLALGLEALDFCRQSRIAHPIRVLVEGAVPPRVQRHDSCLHVLLFSREVRTPVVVRLVDETRRFVPRRLTIPIATEAAVTAGEPPTNPVPAASRAWRPMLFPGAAYDVGAPATGLRGRVEANGKPLRWARVVARLPSGEVVGRAHGDDRGEFLLVLGVDPVNLGDLPALLDVEVTVVGPEPIPDPAADPASASDPLWDLPVEQAAQPGQPDPVSAGEELPDSYKAPGRVVVRDVSLPLGRITSDPVPYLPV